jgi:hypothetical protein
MGNLCGKPSKGNFDGPGRVVGSAPAQNDNAKASLPAQARKVGGPPRTLGAAAGGSGSGGALNADNDARRAAAEAAEVGHKRENDYKSDVGGRRTRTGVKPMTTTVWF